MVANWTRKMRLEAKQERALTTIFLLSLLPLLPICFSGVYALMVFFAWPLVLGYSVYCVAGLTGIYNNRPIVAGFALAVLMLTHALLLNLTLLLTLLLELPRSEEHTSELQSQFHLVC